MDTSPWVTETVMDETHAVLRDPTSGIELSRWKRVAGVGYLIRNRGKVGKGGGPGWLRPKQGVPAAVTLLLAEVPA